LENDERACLAAVSPCADGGDARSLQDIQRVDKTLPTPIQNMIVGKHAGLNPGSTQYAGVLGAHPIVDPFVNRPVRSGDSGLKVDQSDVG
jgi:hypothetical protein